MATPLVLRWRVARVAGDRVSRRDARARDAHHAHGDASCTDDSGCAPDSARRADRDASPWFAAHVMPGGRRRPAHPSGRPPRTAARSPSILLAGGDDGRRRMAYSGALRSRGDSAGRGLAAAMVVSGGRPVLLVAGHPAVAKQGASGAMGSAAVPLLRDAPLRRTLGLSRVLRPRGLSNPSRGTARFRDLSAAGPGICRRPDVVLRHVRLHGARAPRDVEPARSSRVDSALARVTDCPGAKIVPDRPRCPRSAGARSEGAARLHGSAASGRTRSTSRAPDDSRRPAARNPR